MQDTINIHEFLKLSKNTAVVDVRTPQEFSSGHLPGAFNIPLFTNAERAEVGTIYKKAGKQEAVIKGLEYVGPRLKDFSVKALEIAKNNKILVYCWRGGMRSASMAWLFKTIGLEAVRLEGGYKAYREEVFSIFDRIKNLIVLSGYTGSGKSHVLNEIQKQGGQVLHLEEIARHKGSAFGRLGQKKQQPSTEQFANILHEKLSQMNLNEAIWTEDESKRIGDIHQPDNFYEKLRNSELVRMEISKKERISNLVKDYAHFPKEKLNDAIQRISKRLGFDKAEFCFQAIENNDFETVADIALSYYDKTYLYGLSKRNKEQVHFIELKGGNFDQYGKKIMQFYKKNYKT